MTKPVGGRGKKAPYETTTIRVPLPILDQVESMIEAYRLSVLDGCEVSNQRMPDLETAKSELRKILKSKKSARVTGIKLLQVLYNTSITESELLD